MKRAAILSLACLMITMFASLALADSLELVSSNAEGEIGNNDSTLPAISADGRYVVFISRANNLVPGDSNNYWDVFVRDRLTGEVTRVNVDSNGAQANVPLNWALFDSNWPSISDDGRYVAFSSNSTNLVPDDTNNSFDIFVHDMVNGETRLVSVAPDGEQPDCRISYFSMSGNGRYVAFTTYNCSRIGLYLHDLATGTTKELPFSTPYLAMNSDYRKLSLSADGRYLVFYTYESDPVTNQRLPKVYLYDTVDMTYQMVSTGKTWDTSYGWNPSISADGRFIVFTSGSDNLDAKGSQNSVLDVYIVDRVSGGMEHVTPFLNWGSEVIAYSDDPRISADDRFVVFGGTVYTLDGKTYTRVGLGTFLYDRQRKDTEVLFMDTSAPAISADGRTIAFIDLHGQFEGDTNGRLDIYAYSRDSISGTDQPCEKIGGLVDTLTAMKGADKGKFVSLAQLAHDACESGDTRFAALKLEVLMDQLAGNPGKTLSSAQAEAAISLTQSCISGL